MQDFKNIIYAICNPDTQEPVYIGKSTSGFKRPLQHLNGKGGNNKLSEWVKLLKEKNKFPIIVILEYCLFEVLLEEKESFWIKRYIQNGTILFNNLKTSNLNPIEYYSENIGNIVKSNRMFKNYTQDELSKICNISRSTLSLIERNENFNFKSLMLVLKALDINPFNEIEFLKSKLNKRVRN